MENCLYNGCYDSTITSSNICMIIIHKMTLTQIKLAFNRAKWGPMTSS